MRPQMAVGRKTGQGTFSEHPNFSQLTAIYRIATFLLIIVENMSNTKVTFRVMNQRTNSSMMEGYDLYTAVSIYETVYCECGADKFITMYGFWSSELKDM